MKDVLGFDVQTATYIASPATVFLFVALIPVIYSTWVARQHRPQMPRRLLCMLTVTSLIYGLLNFFVTVVGDAGSGFLVFMTPPMEASGHLHPGFFIHFLRALESYWWVCVSPMLVVSAVILTKYRARRWGRIVEALASTAL